MTTALCIVDMQPDFADTVDPVVDEVIRQVKLAKRRKAPIVLVEYKDEDIIMGNTVTSITDAIGDYPNVSKVHKYNDGGGNEIDEEFKNFSGKFRLVGVNTSYCICSTAVQLHNLGRKVEVSKEACNCYDHSEGIKTLRKNGIKITK